MKRERIKKLKQKLGLIGKCGQYDICWGYEAKLGTKMGKNKLHLFYKLEPILKDILRCKQERHHTSMMPELNILVPKNCMSVYIHLTY